MSDRKSTEQEFWIELWLFHLLELEIVFVIYEINGGKSVFSWALISSLFLLYIRRIVHS
ncbi:hypothetical protein P872_09150 [Rhodonellum psychrophilum GCM71 = DSM 17998]|uniref:Uncharacterized protein n=1 Tax=Rhodonellum psychrophilum GCM71 = DSM 17998 TaxID=1123057 RepID=U5BXA6_9BACT|nr:hypothetical protein P872_09150 [Rhodonellum psychrophilum GCM71 = DSM 17998]